MNEPDTTSRASNQSPPYGRVLPILTIVLGIIAIALLIKQNSQQVASEQRMSEKIVSIEAKINIQATAQQATIEQHFAAMQATLKQESEQQAAIVQSLNEKLATVETAINNQTAVLDRAMGKVIPIVLPLSLTDQLTQLEGVLEDQNSWPKTSAEADILQSKLGDIVHKIPPWAEEDENLLLRLNQLRWGIPALALLAMHSTGEDLATLEAGISDTLDEKPNNAPQVLVEKLLQEKEMVKTEYNDYRRQTAIDNATNALQEGIDEKVVVDVWQKLGEWATDGTANKQIAELLSKLHARLLSDATDNLINSSKVVLNNLDKSENVSFKQATLEDLLTSVVSRRIALLNEPDVLIDSKQKLEQFSADLQNQLNKINEQITSAQATEQSSKRMNYQKWATNQIIQFEAASEAAENQPIPGGIIHHIKTDYTMLEKAVATFLLPISPEFLDPAVEHIYSDDYAIAWKSLHDQKGDFVITLAIQEASSKRETPDSVPHQL